MKKKNEKWVLLTASLVFLAAVSVALFVFYLTSDHNKNHVPKQKVEPSSLEMRDVIIVAIFPVYFGPDTSKTNVSAADSLLWNRPFGHLVTAANADNERRTFYVPDPESYRWQPDPDPTSAHNYQLKTFRLLAAKYWPKTNVILEGVRFRRIQIDRINDPKLLGVEWIVREAEGPYTKK